jgi:hypothetical protein
MNDIQALHILKLRYPFLKWEIDDLPFLGGEGAKLPSLSRDYFFRIPAKSMVGYLRVQALRARSSFPAMRRFATAIIRHCEPFEPITMDSIYCAQIRTQGGIDWVFIDADRSFIVAECMSTPKKDGVSNSDD